MIWRQLSLENCVFFFIKQQPVHCSAVVTTAALRLGARRSRLALAPRRGLPRGRSIPWGPLADMAEGVINVAFA